MVFTQVSNSFIKNPTLSLQSVQTANFNVTSNFAYPVNTTSGAITATLPSSPAVGDAVSFIDYAGTFGTNNLIIATNTKKINASSINAVCSVNREGLTLVYVDSTQGWITQSSVYVSGAPFSQTITASYLIAGGGGSGGTSNATNTGAGGGGAGQYITGSSTLTQGTNYPITVGAGGAAVSGNTHQGNTGSSSTFNSLTAIGGGSGGAVSANGGTGASGGGAGGGGGNTGGTGTAGNNGGNAPSGGVAPDAAGGGGGSGGVGGSNSSASVAGAGGAGTSSSITGTSTEYCHGGGGGVGSGGTAGSGGTTGGTGGVGSNGNDATANSGSGGGGAGSTGTSGAGGSGVVILSILTANYSGTTTGSPTITTSGGNTIMKFTASGSYTA
jgi:hypothetical protein